MFAPNSTVCFLGDSITAAGLWIAETFEKLRRDGVRVYNCGVPGDTAFRCLKRMYADCFSYSPQYVVVMFGMNDIPRGLYAPSCREEGKEGQIERAYQVYRESMEQVIKGCIAAKAQVILCTPTPYDEISSAGEENLMCGKGLEVCAHFIRETAEKNGFLLMDFFKELSPYVEKGIIRPDRVHPNEKGHHLMAQLFLEKMGYEPDRTEAFLLPQCQKTRFELEQKLCNMGLVEWCVLFEEKQKRDMTARDKEAYITSYYNDREDKGTYVPDCCLLYLRENHLRGIIKGRLVEETLKLLEG